MRVSAFVRRPVSAVILHEAPTFFLESLSITFFLVARSFLGLLQGTTAHTFQKDVLAFGFLVRPNEVLLLCDTFESRPRAGLQSAPRPIWQIELAADIASTLEIVVGEKPGNACDWKEISVRYYILEKTNDGDSL